MQLLVVLSSINMNIKSDFFKDFIMKNKFKHFDYEDKPNRGTVLNKQLEYKSCHDLNDVFQTIIKVKLIIFRYALLKLKMVIDL